MLFLTYVQRSKHVIIIAQISGEEKSKQTGVRFLRYI